MGWDGWGRGGLGGGVGELVGGLVGVGARDGKEEGVLIG